MSRAFRFSIPISLLLLATISSPPLAAQSITGQNSSHTENSTTDATDELVDGSYGNRTPPPASLRLASLHVVGAGPMMPDFAPRVFHYAVRCEKNQTVSVSATTGGGAHLRLNGESVSNPLSDAKLRLAEDENLTVEAALPNGAKGAYVRVAYTVHCVPQDFPDVEVLHSEPGIAPGLLLITPYYTPSGSETGPVSHLAMLDRNGVPRFTRRISPAAHNFRWHEGARRYSYNEASPNRSGEVVLLDERLEETARVGTVGGLAPAMMHDFLITDEGNYLFISNNPIQRDFSRYPARDGEPKLSEAQVTHDSVIQEIAPDGREVFRWNAWDHLKLSDCLWWRFPDEYAKLNSLHLDSEGNILASFRACSQVLKIGRPSGIVLWQLGGSDPAELDPFDSRRPTFSRPWYRPTGDPYGRFCAQHSVQETAPGYILMFDNGQCSGIEGRDSRIVEYLLGAGGKAAFVRHYEPGWPTLYGGAVTHLDNGNWLIAWGGGPGNITLSEVDTAGQEVFALRLVREPELAMTYRAWRHTGLTADEK